MNNWSTAERQYCISDYAYSIEFISNSLHSNTTRTWTWWISWSSHEWLRGKKTVYFQFQYTEDATTESWQAGLTLDYCRFYSSHVQYKFNIIFIIHILQMLKYHIVQISFPNNWYLPYNKEDLPWITRLVSVDNELKVVYFIVCNWMNERTYERSNVWRLCMMIVYGIFIRIHDVCLCDNFTKKLKFNNSYVQMD